MSETNSVPPVIELESLLAPIEGDNPCGENLRYQGAYDQIKEARREDEVLSQGAWSRELKVAEWPKVIQLSTDALLKKTKDLQIAAWLTEGLIKNEKMDRWAGLRDGLKLVRGFHESFWENVYPEIDPEDDEGPLAARANVLAAMDVRLGSILQELPLTAGAKYSYLQYQEAKKFDSSDSNAAGSEQQSSSAQAAAENKITSEDWRKAKAATSRDFLEARYALINECWDQFQALDAVMDEKFARETPGLNALKKSLDEIRTFVEIFVKEKREAEPRDGEQAGAATGDEEAGGGGSSGGLAVSGGAIRGRQEALKRLTEVADYFRQTEPHSPVSFLVQRAVKWGNMPLDSWLADVVKDGATLDALRETLGISTDNSGE